MTRSIDNPGPADEITRELAELVRLLNHSVTKDGLTYPGDLYTVVGNLDTAAGGLPQGLAAMERFITDLHERAHVRVDDGSDPTSRIAHTITSLRAAAASARELQSALGDAHTALSRLAYAD